MNAVTSERHSETQMALISLTVVLSAVLILYLRTFSSIFATWQTDAYSHGFLILPISAFLVWSKHDVLAEVSISRSKIGIVIAAGMSMLWWLGDNLGVQLVSQFAVVCMIPASVLAVFGREFVKEIRFALGFLIFAVPFGEFLIPYLIDFTAAFAVEALNIFGIPVLRDGPYFQVPTGSYEVAKACAGLRFFVATLAFSVLFGHFLFIGVRKVILFVAFALCLSILMNGIRATSVVLILHFTDFDIAAGPDHEFVGWILYGLMLSLIIWVGCRWRDASVDKTVLQQSQNHLTEDSIRERRLSIFSMGVFVVLATLAGPILNSALRSPDMPGDIRTSGLPSFVDGWTADDELQSSWRPSYIGYSQMSLGNYARDDHIIDVALIRYRSQNQGADITNTTNSVVDLNEWSLGYRDKIRVVFDQSNNFQVNEVIASRPGERRLIWYWTSVNGSRTTGTLETKIAEIKQLLSFEPVVSTEVILSSPIVKMENETRTLLRQFLADFESSFSYCLSIVSSYRECTLGMQETKES